VQYLNTGALANSPIFKTLLNVPNAEFHKINTNYYTFKVETPNKN
jgi:hypothetical protein